MPAHRRISSAASLKRDRSIVRTFVNHGIDSIDDSKDPRAQGDVFAAQSTGISAAIELFVMRQDEFCGVGKKLEVR